MYKALALFGLVCIASAEIVFNDQFTDGKFYFIFFEILLVSYYTCIEDCRVHQNCAWGLFAPFNINFDCASFA